MNSLECFFLNNYNVILVSYGTISGAIIWRSKASGALNITSSVIFSWNWRSLRHCQMFFFTKTGFGALWRLHRSSAICAISGTKLDNRYMAPYLNVPTSGWRHIFQDIVYGKYIRRLISMSFCMEHQETIMNRPKSENWPKLKPKFNFSGRSFNRSLIKYINQIFQSFITKIILEDY